MSAVSPVGTLAYIIDEQALLVRVNNGWQYIAVSIKFFYILYHKIFIHYIIHRKIYVNSKQKIQKNVSLNSNFQI